MRDDRTMDTFDVVVAELFGDAVDAREVRDLVSKQNDASEVHAPGNILTKEQMKRQKKQAQIGLASNILGLAAGGAAVVTAARNPALRKPLASNAGPMTARAGKYLKTDAGRARLYRVGAGGALGLQVANTGGDVIANRVLNREAKKEIKKALGDIVDARRRGVISTETAVAMSQDIVELAKKDVSGHNQILDAVDAIAPALPSKKLQAANTGIQTGRKVGAKAKKLVPQAAVPPVVPNLPEPVAKVALDVVWSGEIAKRDDDKRQVFGFATVTHVGGEPVVDRQGDYIPLEEIEKAAYTYVIESRKGGDMHARDGEMPLHTSDMVESFVITPEKLAQMGLAEDALPHGWWVGFQVNDDKQWNDVKTGKRTGFSVHGSGRRVEKMMGV